METVEKTKIYTGKELKKEITSVVEEVKSLVENNKKYEFKVSGFENLHEAFEEVLTANIFDISYNRIKKINAYINQLDNKPSAIEWEKG